MASRKPASERRSKTHLTVIASDADRDLFTEAAKACGLNRTQWMLPILRDAAKAAITKSRMEQT